MIYLVRVKMPAIDDEVTLSATSEAEAAKLAIASAVRRVVSEMQVSVEEVEDGGSERV